MLRYLNNRISWALIGAFFSLAGAVFFFPDAPGAVGFDAASRLASVIGVQLGVMPNEYNTVAEQLKTKEAELAAREKELAAREDALNAASPRAVILQNKALVMLLAAIALLFALIAVNFYLDWRRRPRAAGGQVAPRDVPRTVSQ